MNALTKFFMERRTLFWSFCIGILIAGVLAFMQMPKLEDPAVAVKQAVVVVPYPGATAHEVEMNVAQMVEDNLRTLPDVKKIKTDCQDGMAMFTVEFQMTVLMKDLEQHFDLVRRKVNDLAVYLPQGCYSPIVVDDMMDIYGIFYALTSDGYDYPEMYKYAKYIRRELSKVEGVKRVNIIGNRDEVINIILSKEKITRNGMIPMQIISSLQSVGKPVAAGSYSNGGDLIKMRIDSPIENEEDIRNMLISTIDGKQIRLEDIATVERTYAEPQRNGFFVNGKPALGICIAMENSAIVPDVGKAVDARLAEIMPNVPVGLSTEKIFFQPDKVSDAISSFMWNLIESVLIVIVVLMFTMGFRSGVIIGYGLILTIAASFPILLTMGTTLQRISLGAFIIAMGMLVDNAVVIMDGILIDKKKGLHRDIYLYRIGKNTAMPLLGATIIAFTAFIAVFLSPDSVGEYASDLFLVLAVSLLVSWLLALIQVPICADAWLPKTEKNTGKSVMNSPLHRFVRRTIALFVAHRRITIAGAVLLLAVCIYAMTFVKNVFFPDFDYRQFVVECTFPAQTSPDEVKENILKMSDSLQQNPDIDRVVACMGATPARYCLVRPMTSGGDCYGELIVDCKDYKTVVEQIPLVREKLRMQYPDAYIRIRKYNFSIGSSHTVEVEFAGPDPAVLRDLSRQAEDIMRRSPYIDPYSVQNNWKPKSKNLVAKYVQQDALRSNISRSDVGNALLAATDGMTVGVINDQDRMMMINLMVRNADGSKITKVEDIPVWSTLNIRPDDIDPASLMTSDGLDKLKDRMFRAAPLGNITQGVDVQWDECYISRLNGQRVIEAECDPNPYNSDATVAKAEADIKAEIEAIPLPDGYSLRWVGEGELQGEAISHILKYLPLTFFIILLVLLLLFNSWKKVTLILVCIPFAMCGVSLSLLITRQPFTFMALVGIYGLIGMMVKNAVVLVDEITRLINEEGEHPYHAILNATASRVRPVVMASLTTIVGMIPLLGDPMYGSMAVAIMGGLAVGTLITLLLLPLFYAAMFHVRKPKE